MSRILTKETVSTYFKALVTKNTDLQDYAGPVKQELDDKLTSVAGLNGPILNFYGYRWKLSGNNQRTFNTRTISFAIVIPGIKNDDYEGQEAAIEQAEAIALEVLSRIYQDSQREEIQWLYNNLIKESVQAEEIRLLGTDGLCGMDISFDLRVQEPLVVTPDKWSDGDLFCS